MDYFKRSTNSSSPVADSTKRALSDPGSPESHDAKKVNEELETSALSEPIEFEAGTPHWVPLMIQAMDKMQRDIASVQQDMASVLTKVDEISEFKAEVTKKMTELEKSVKFIADKYDEQKKENDDFREELKQLRSGHDALRGDHNALRNDHELLRRQADTNEQHSRNECLVLHGVAETENEDAVEKFAAVVNGKLGITMQTDAVRRAHRLGAPRDDGKPRAIIARFWHMGLRNQVYRSKKSLKGQKLVITENLTLRRLKILGEAKAKYGERNVWTQEGRLYANNGHKKISLVA